MVESMNSVNQIIRDLLNDSDARFARILPDLQLAPELDRVPFEVSKLKPIVLGLLDTMPDFTITNKLVLQSGMIGVPTQRCFGATTSGSFLTISLASKDLPPGLVEHTPSSDISGTTLWKNLNRAIEEYGGTLLVSGGSGSLGRIRCILPVPLREEQQAPRGHETILLVEDEEFVRNVTREVLELSGYRVLEAIDADSGIQTFMEHSEEIDLLLTDVVMPGMNGHDLALRLMATSPNLKAIFMSGYTENAVTRQGLSDPRLVYLQKPFTLDVLTKKVREVLNHVTHESDGLRDFATQTAAGHYF